MPWNYSSTLSAALLISYNLPHTRFIHERAVGAYVIPIETYFYNRLTYLIDLLNLQPPLRARLAARTLAI